MKNKSIWINNNVENKRMLQLDKNISCDILIIGGGMAGLSAAYNLMDSKMDVVLIEKDICGLGATSKNTGKLTWMQDLIYSRLTKNYNDEIAKTYYDSQVDAISLIVKIIKDNKIDCHLAKTNSYVFSDNKDDYNKFNDEISFYEKHKIKYKILDKLPVNYDCGIALEGYNSYVFNPYEYLVSLKNIVKEKIKIYEDTRCIDVSKKNSNYVIKTSTNHIINCKYVVIASHYPPFIIPFLTPFKTKVDKFFIGASKAEDNKSVQIISYGEKSVSMRYYQFMNNNYFIYGRRSHGTTNHLDVRDDYNELNNEYKKYFGKEIEYFYHTHDLMTYDGLPFIGSVDRNLYICTGFNKWGNTNGTLAGKIISDLICSRKNRFSLLFVPKRGLSLDKIKNLFLYNIEVGSSFVLNKINSNKKFYDDNVKIEYINGKKCGIYIDNEGNKHVVSNICPHMKCNLIFNYIDKSWDCPCHASRFTIDGDIICGPSAYDIKLKKI